MFAKPLIFAVISVLVVALVYSSSSTFLIFGIVEDISCDPQNGKTRCCGTEYGDVPGYTLPEPIATYCTTCDNTTPPSNCTPREKVKIQEPTPPTSGPVAPPQGGVLEQPEQPPLFGGQNDAGVPPTGGIQPPTGTTQPTPGGGNVPTEGGSAEQPPMPQPDQGGGLPTIKNQENVPPGGGVAEQPEDEGQEDSSEGSETAGPLT